MESILIMIGLVLIGFMVAEFQNAYLGKQQKNSKEYFSFIGVSITEKDTQRLFFALFLGVGMLVGLPSINEWFGLDIQGYIAYMVTGYAPSLVMYFVSKQLKKKIGVNGPIRNATVDPDNPTKPNEKG